MPASRLAPTISASNLADRLLHFKITPVPATLKESQLVYQQLKKHGPIATYRSLKNDPTSPNPSTVLAITRTATAQSQFLSLSPLRIQIPTTPFDLLRPNIGVLVPLTPYAPPKPSPHSPLGKVTSSSPAPSPTKTFTVQVSTSRYNHRAWIRRQAFYGAFEARKSSRAVRDARPGSPAVLMDVRIRRERFGSEVREEKKSRGGKSLEEIVGVERDDDPGWEDVSPVQGLGEGTRSVINAEGQVVGILDAAAEGDGEIVDRKEEKGVEGAALDSQKTDTPGAEAPIKERRSI
ncbi:MAG: hypothetical protein M1814_001119 [Vezdaea aestivalis]|nr:MAG: hypothetical protein M1814_001119 [Vezdaea aestivalis]